MKFLLVRHLLVDSPARLGYYLVVSKLKEFLVNTTRHILARMSQRGITGALVARVLEFGDCNGDDKIILNRKLGQKILSELDKLRTEILKIIDKGGVTLVVEGNALITAYNTNSYKRGG